MHCVILLILTCGQVNGSLTHNFNPGICVSSGDISSVSNKISFLQSLTLIIYLFIHLSIYLFILFCKESIMIYLAWQTHEATLLWNYCDENYFFTTRKIILYCQERTSFTSLHLQDVTYALIQFWSSGPLKWNFMLNIGRNESRHHVQICCSSWSMLVTLWHGQNGHYTEAASLSLFSLTFVPKSPIDNKSALVWEKLWNSCRV